LYSYDREGVNGIDIGFALPPEFEKQGYAFESVFT
jgi:RimJ/RimL family protein N-acetyltransferase